MVIMLASVLLFILFFFTWRPLVRPFLFSEALCKVFFFLLGVLFSSAPLGPSILGLSPGPSLGLPGPPLLLPCFPLGPYVPWSLWPWALGPGAAKTNDSSLQIQ